MRVEARVTAPPPERRAVPRLIVVLVLALSGCGANSPPPAVVERTPAGAGELVRVPVVRLVRR